MKYDILQRGKNFEEYRFSIERKKFLKPYMQYFLVLELKEHILVL